ncbi:hypothetical protein H2199_007522 [Coniosporium tulheliwenetii]|uniref:Uncharacterized protein n=1 Tax=Coniosporium tulheliwenetii TaxID=3383036 RepID=A0ACC2YPC5_9PEZI|nr:hypothetical protein H2199_007522 [Cladosporium sp. JES 115]
MAPPRTTHHQLQPLVMPQWPSTLVSQSTYVPPIYPAAPAPMPVPVGPTSTPLSASSTGSRTSSTPRKTLTDADRRRMCLYHEEHPSTKQTEIGAMFGVERSTVSKVLRNKEKYLCQDDGSRSPIKRSKGKFPDIERALSNWARNHVRQGYPITDAMIKEKARFFSTTVGNGESPLKANSTSWLEKFKQKNNINGCRSRKISTADDAEVLSNPASNAQTPTGASPTSPGGTSSPPLKGEEAEFGSGHRPFYSQSDPSLSSVFADAATSSFSAGPLSPTSPFFTPDSACGPNPFFPPQQGRAPQPSSNFQRPRSQTFPLLQGMDSYMSPPPSSEANYLNSAAVESPLSELPPPLNSVDEVLQRDQKSAQQPSNSMQPPPLPALAPAATISGSTPLRPAQQLISPISPDTSTPGSPSQEDARRALELVMNFCQAQPSGFVEPQEYVTIGKLMEKLKLKVEGR